MAIKQIKGNTTILLADISNALAEIIAPKRRNNLTPVFQVPIDQHVGIEITGQFKTSDSTTEGRMSYITVRRHEEVAIPFDGYGISWSVGDGSKYNIYIVDTDALTSDVFINEEQMWDQTGGVNQFLAAAALEIVKDTWYQFNIKIYSKNGMDVWINRADSVPGELNAANRTIYRGQTYPPYIPQSAGDHFGVAVLETENYEWWYRNIKITSIMETFPMHLFKIKAKEADFPGGEAFSLTYYGAGYGTNYEALKWYAYNQTTTAWDLCGTGSGSPLDTLSSLKMEKSYTDIDKYRDANEFINILATPYNYLDTDHFLNSYYVAAHNTLLSGVHRGNMSDIYIQDKTNIAIETQSVVLSSPDLVLRTIDTFKFPIVDIIAISRTLTGALYTENVDYAVTRPKVGEAFSTRDGIKIVFDDPGIGGISVDIQYRYYTDGSTVQTLLDSDQYRYPGTDNLAKIYPYSIVKIASFDYKGPVTEDAMVAALCTYINGISDKILEASDLVNVAYQVGATYVDLSNISIEVKDQNYLGTYSNTDASSTLTLIGDLKTFFCDTTSALGINKIG